MELAANAGATPRAATWVGGSATAARRPSALVADTSRSDADAAMRPKNAIMKLNDAILCTKDTTMTAKGA